MYKSRGVYVVIGGAGGIGGVWSEYMIRTYQAQIIWIGRREKDAAIQEKLDSLATIGPAPYYIAADATDHRALQQAYEEIKERYGQVNGVIHSVLLLLDHSLANMKEENLQAGLSAKVNVSVRMAQVFRQEPLDFVLFFSSLASFTKGPGQTNYSSGCVFKDAFAHQLSQEWPCAVKVVNWGYWGNVGIVASKVYQDRMTNIGLGSIEAPEAMEALEKLLAGPVDQIVLLKTIKPLSIKGTNTGELITVYQRSLAPYVQNIEIEASEALLVQGQNKMLADLQEDLQKPQRGQYIQEMEELLCRLLYGQLQSVGLFAEKELVIADLKRKTGLIDLYDRWLEESLAVLTRNNDLRYDGNSYFVIDTTQPRIDSLWKEWDLKKSHWPGDPSTKAQVTLAEVTLRALPDILTGKILATDVMFPNSSMELVEGIYKRNLVADYFNEVLANTVVGCVQKRLEHDSSAQIRMIEIGAGTGGTSTMIFRKLRTYRDHIQEYCYTDISKAFLMHAEKEYGSENPYLTYKIFNVEEPLAQQGISANAYDLVIAANVLHATKNIRQTLRNTKAALKKNGLILLNEMADNTLFGHLTFGLLEGWWLYEDPELRIPGCPGLSAQVWQEVLEDEGFQSVHFPAQGAQELGQQIIIAESNGVVRQKQLQPSATPMKRDSGTREGWLSGRHKLVQRSLTQNQHLAPHKVIPTSVAVTDQMVEDYVRDTIIEKLSDSLKVAINEIDADDSFADYGVDSITGIQLVQVINEALMIELETTSLFEYSSVNKLTTHILSRYKDIIMVLRERGNLAPHKVIPTSVAVTDQIVEDYVRDTIIEKLSDSLKVAINEIDADDSFADYGVDSITGIQLVQVINEALMIELETTSLFEYSSVNRLTTHILSRYKDIITVLGERGKQADTVRNDLPSDSQHEQPAYSYPKRFPRRVVFQEPNVQRKESTRDSSLREPIAIIGMSGRFANSNNVNELWEHLSRGDDLIEEVSRWDLSEYYPEGGNYCRYGSFLNDIDQFDPLFFNISGLEATYMSPQQRLFLEEAWKALEDAGCVETGVQGRLCGVYVGCTGGDYQQLFRKEPPAQAFWGNAGSVTPARIAYYLNLQGPAIAVDTACSSSLVAIHLACQGLWAGETELAIAGGVFVQSTPEFYLVANRAEMLSPTGHCHTFDEQADGFVPGEGVGVVVLKRLQEAIADGDNIYGVIRGSGINQDGTTNGITAPSANSQERLERYVYDTFDIHPGQIQVIEAHGTGTKLGDPIEYQALTRSFRAYTDKQEYCAIGSIKTNLGHAASAAGIAGLVKILLSLRHQQIPPSLHFQSGNSNIQFKGSPFYVNTKLKDWAVEPESKRCAAISAFGFSGTNAHIVIEEAPKIDRRHSGKPGYLIVLSARTFEQLRQQVEQLLVYCEREPQVDCGNMSYTLLLGRKHFNHRLACTVRNRDEVIALLNKWLEKGKVSQVYVSELHKADHREQPSLKRYGNQCIQNCHNSSNANDYLEHLTTIADLYIQGYELEFGQLFADENYSKIPLPTYPFAKERYWVPEATRTTAPAPVTTIHPLLHQNTSDLSEQRFTSTFTGREFFLADHTVQGQHLLPGVAYLEMARTAVQEAAGALQEDKTIIKLKNVVWARPIAVADEPVQVHIGLYPEETGGITYEIYSEPEGDKTGPIVHSQGIAELIPAREAPTLDLSGLQAKCSQGVLSANQIYEAFRFMGIDYGEGHRGIEEIYVGPNQVLARLSIPSSVLDTQNQYILHPSLLDSALQASIGLMMNAGEAKLSAGDTALKAVLPFALKELEVFSPCTPAMWALVRYSDGSTLGDRVQKYDIDLCDDQGNVCVRMKGFTSRVLEGDSNSAERGAAIGTLLLQPCWREQAVIQTAPVPDYARHLVVLCEQQEVFPENIEAQMNGARCLILQSRQQEIGERFQTYACQVFEEIQNILKEKPKDRELIQIVNNEQHLFSGLLGLLKTAQMENPKLIVQMIEVETGEDPQTIIAQLQESSRSPSDRQVRYQDGKRYVASLSEVGLSQKEAAIPWKDHGVYLISGGAGGLGLIFANEIAQKAQDTTLVLTGRSMLSEDKQTKLKELEEMGTRIIYRQVDVTDKQAVEELIQDIRQEFGRLDGIIHAAGVIRDNFIIKKTKEELLAVLAPKVTGLVNLDEASQDLDLDLFVLFSSMAGVIGNPGQADYAAGNAFMDAYAGYRNELAARGRRHGRTLSVNWPLWQEGGMSIDRETERMMRQSGFIPMQTAAGIQALYQGLASGQALVLVAAGDMAKMRQKLLTATIAAPPLPEQTAWIPQIDPGLLREKTLHRLIVLFGEITKLSVDKIDPDEPLESYGVDSIMITRLNQKLAETLKSFPKPYFMNTRPWVPSRLFHCRLSYRNAYGGAGLGNQVQRHPQKISATLSRRRVSSTNIIENSKETNSKLDHYNTEQVNPVSP